MTSNLAEDEGLSSIKKLLQQQLLPLRKQEEIQLSRFRAIKKSQVDSKLCSNFLNFLEHGHNMRLAIISETEADLGSRYISFVYGRLEKISSEESDLKENYSMLTKKTESLVKAILILTY